MLSLVLQPLVFSAQFDWILMCQVSCLEELPVVDKHSARDQEKQ